MDEINLYIIDHEGAETELTAPTDMNLSLMELLVANEYPILATCGGLALCATCHVVILEANIPLPEPNNEELDMLDTLPILTSTSRLSCQLRLNNELDGLKFKIFGD